MIVLLCPTKKEIYKNDINKINYNGKRTIPSSGQIDF